MPAVSGKAFKGARRLEKRGPWTNSGQNSHVSNGRRETVKKIACRGCSRKFGISAATCRTPEKQWKYLRPLFFVFLLGVEVLEEASDEFSEPLVPFVVIVSYVP